MDGRSGAARYEIRVGGRLGETLLGAFPGLHAEAEGAATALIGMLPDQAALHGVLAQVEALGLELLEVRRLQTAPFAEEVRASDNGGTAEARRDGENDGHTTRSATPRMAPEPFDQQEQDDGQDGGRHVRH